MIHHHARIPFQSGTHIHQNNRYQSSKFDDFYPGDNIKTVDCSGADARITVSRQGTHGQEARQKDR